MGEIKIKLPKSLTGGEIKGPRRSGCMLVLLALIIPIVTACLIIY